MGRAGRSQPLGRRFVTRRDAPRFRSALASVRLTLALPHRLSLEKSLYSRYAWSTPCLLALTLIPLLAAGPARAEASSATSYLAMCRQYGVASGKPNLSAGEAYEVRGALSGLAENGAGFFLLVKTDDSTLTLTGEGAAPAFNAGMKIRALVKASSSLSTNELTLLGLATEGDVATEQLAQARPTPQAAPTGRAASSYPKGFAKTKTLRRRSVPLTSRSLTQTRIPSGSREVFDAYKKAVRYFNRTGSEDEVNRIVAAVLNYSIKYQVDARLVMAIFAVESNFKPTATSRSGAMGIGQLMPGTAADLGVRNAYDPDQNVEGAVKYIRSQLDQYQGHDDWTRLQLALASYNAGPGAVRKYNGVPPYQETQAYVKRVSSWFLHFLGQQP